MSTTDFSAAAKAGVDAAVDTVLSPVERLELSRARMRVFLERKKSGTTRSGIGASGIGGKMSEWADGLRANPVLGAVIDAVHGWWTTHPLHSVVLMAGDAVEEVAAPWIRRYPLAVVGGALAVGVLASKLRPWRWLGKPALFAGLTSQIAAQMMTHAPLEFLIDAFTKFAKPKSKQSAAATSPDPRASEVVEPVYAAQTSPSNLEPGIDSASSVVAPVGSAPRASFAQSAPVA